MRCGVQVGGRGTDGDEAEVRATAVLRQGFGNDALEERGDLRTRRYDRGGLRGDDGMSITS